MGKWDVLIKIGKVALPVIGFAAGQALGAIKDKEESEADEKKLERASEKGAEKALEKFLNK